jgi:hypothetical protein
MTFRSIRPALPVLACCFALPALAIAAPARDFAAMSQARASVQASAAAARTSAATALSASGEPAKEIYANPYRAYPPSCLVDGLPFGEFDAVHGAQASVLLFGDPAQCLSGGDANECNYTETDTFKVWRVPCSGGTSAVLVEIDRPGNASTTLYPTLPAIYAVQGNNALYVRYADDPNTIYTTTYANTPLVNSDIFVLENFKGGPTQFNYNQAFTLFVDNFTGNTATNPRSFTFAAYNPANYPEAALALPISGYMSTNWYDPAHGGEGMLVQVYDNNDGATRFFTAAWYTFDPLGLPFWLYAQGTINIGDRSTGNVDTYYATNGGFAGNFGPNATFTKWGTINVSFPDCNHMNFSYSGSTDVQTNGPSGTGSRSGWIRLANINSLVCN